MGQAGAVLATLVVGIALAGCASDSSPKPAKPLTMRSVICDRGKRDRQVDISAKLSPQTWQQDSLELSQRTFDILQACCPSGDMSGPNPLCRNLINGFRIGDVLPEQDHGRLVQRVFLGREATDADRRLVAAYLEGTGLVGNVKVCCT